MLSTGPESTENLEMAGSDLDINDLATPTRGRRFGRSTTRKQVCHLLRLVRGGANLTDLNLAACVQQTYGRCVACGRVDFHDQYPCPTPAPSI